MRFTLYLFIILSGSRKYITIALESLHIHTFHGWSSVIYQNKWKIPDRGTCPMIALDTIFVATNFEEVAMKDNPDKHLCRYEFYEILVRIAYQKYFISKTSQTLPRAVSRLINENIFSNSEHVLTGQKWRNDYLWCIEIDDLYKANMTSLKSVFKMFKFENTNHWVLEDAVNICKDKLDINISVKDTKLAFSLSKMSIINEMDDSDKLFHLEFVEYLEFIARIGQIIFIKHKTMSLYSKIVYIMQKFFALIPSEVLHPTADTLIDSESDDEEYQ